jgi:hypothetical protein
LPKIASTVMAKKKRRSSGAGLTGAEKQEQRQRRLEEKRKQREEALERQRKAARRERLVRIMLVSLLAVGGIWFFFLRNKPPSEIGGHELVSTSQAGEGQHTDDPVQYDTVPPVAGAHAPRAAACGTYAEQIQNELQVHALEHGAVGLLYRPDVAIEQIRELEDIVGEYSSHVFSAPYDEMDSPIVIVAWGFQMPLDEVDGPAVREFIEEFREKGPEEQECPMDSVATFPEVTPGDAASPGEDATPGGEDGQGSQGGGREGTPEPEDS